MTEQTTPLPWVCSPKAGDAVIAPEAPTTYPAEKRDYGGRVVFESCHRADQQHIIECVTLRPAFDALLQATKERCDCCPGVVCTEAEYGDGAGCEKCQLLGSLSCCRACQIHEARAAVEQARAAVRAQSTDLTVTQPAVESRN